MITGSFCRQECSLFFKKRTCCRTKKGRVRHYAYGSGLVAYAVRFELGHLFADHDKISERWEKATELPSHGHHQRGLQVCGLPGHTRNWKLSARAKLPKEDVWSAAAGDDSRRCRFLSECDIVPWAAPVIIHTCCNCETNISKWCMGISGDVCQKFRQMSVYYSLTQIHMFHLVENLVLVTHIYFI